MLQSAAVWRLMHTADRITKSKNENHCCSPEPPAKSTGPANEQECLFGGEVDSMSTSMTHYTIGAAAYGYNKTLWQEFRKCNVHHELSIYDPLISTNATAESEDLMNCHESLQVMQVCFGGKRLSCLEELEEKEQIIWQILQGSSTSNPPKWGAEKLISHTEELNTIIVKDDNI